jgi:hypothetical protein
MGKSSFYLLIFMMVTSQGHAQVFQAIIPEEVIASSQRALGFVFG